MSIQLNRQISSLATKRIFFAHQSVGNNILSGLEKFINSSDSGVSIKHMDSTRNITEATISHIEIGRNQDPQSKLSDYRNIIDNEIGKEIDIAVLKFCYIDINEHTDIQALFCQYQDTLNDLINRYKNISFIHTTIPLRHNAKGAGIILRELIGRPNKSKMANINRNKFNKLLVNNYPEDQIFDIAKIESTYANGSREYFIASKIKYYSLISDFTFDGGHLNETGSAILARELIEILSENSSY